MQYYCISEIHISNHNGKEHKVSMADWIVPVIELQKCKKIIEENTDKYFKEGEGYYTFSKMEKLGFVFFKFCYGISNSKSLKRHFQYHLSK